MRTNLLSLPRLPVPDLADTLSRYSSSVQPLLTPSLSSSSCDDNLYTNHLNKVSSFASTVGPSLQSRLRFLESERISKQRYPFSYVERHWDDMYLGGRFALPVNSNPFYLLRGVQDSSSDSTSTTGAVLSAMIRFHLKSLSNKLEPDLPHANCMSPFPYMFGTSRVATKDKDTLSLNPASGHVVVIHGGHFHKLKVIDPSSGKPYCGASLSASIDAIMNSPTPDTPSIAVLSAQERDTWAKHRKTLSSSSPVNADSLKTIDAALFVVNLDQGGIDSPHHESEILLHGRDGCGWWDKHQLIRLSNGRLAINFEHSFSDGMIWNRMLHEVVANVSPDTFKSPYKPLGDAYTPPNSPTFSTLSFAMSKATLEHIEVATEAVKRDVGNCSSHLLSFDHFGKLEIKKWRVSPDAAVQMAYQLAYSKGHKDKLPTVYESCATRNFHRGRTEVIRSLTNESKNFVDLMNSPGSSEDARREAFLGACGKHIEVAKLAKNGLGVDRHLLALKKVADDAGITHELFEDETFEQSSAWVLSTSNVSAPFLDRFGFGAVTGDGYGLGYLVHDDDVPINITSYNSSDTTDSGRMAGDIEQSLLDIEKLFK